MIKIECVRKKYFQQNENNKKSKQQEIKYYELEIYSHCV